MIKEFHIHLYYTEETLNVAKMLVSKIQDNDIECSVGRFHERPVGPHPMWSVQLLVKNESFGDLLSFVAVNRNKLTVFSHPVTGDDLKDHVDYAIWMGEMKELNLEAFK
jgi:DOPA 4,5-dioxygenase